MLGLAGRDDPIGLHGALIFVTGLLVIALIGRDYLRAGALRRAAWRIITTIRRKAGIVLAMIWVVFGPCGRRLGGVATGRSRPHLRPGLVELRPAPAGAHHLGHLRLRRQRA